jgi:hypothetical protein
MPEPIPVGTMRVDATARFAAALIKGILPGGVERLVADIPVGRVRAVVDEFEDDAVDEVDGIRR